MGTPTSVLVEKSRWCPNSRTMRSLLPLILLSLLAYISQADGSAHEFGFGPSSSSNRPSKQPDRRVTDPDPEPEVMEEDEDDDDDHHHMEPSKGNGGSKYEYYGNYKSNGYKKKNGKKKYGGYKKKYRGYKKKYGGYGRYDDYGCIKYELAYGPFGNMRCGGGYNRYEPEYGYKMNDDYGYDGGYEREYEEYEPEYGYDREYEYQPEYGYDRDYGYQPEYGYERDYGYQSGYDRDYKSYGGYSYYPPPTYGTNY